MAILMMSAAVPWIGEFMATRSPKRTLHEIAGFQFRHRSSSAKHGSHITMFLAFFYQAIQKSLDLRIGFKIFFDVGSCFFSVILKSWLKPKELMP